MRREIVQANIVVFIASFCTLVIELVAGRILAPFVGVSLYTWTSIIGVVLAGISIGAYLGGLIADRYPRSSTLGWLLFLSGLAALTISPLTHLIGSSEFQTNLMVRILLITTFIFFIPSCLLGMISPVVIKLTLNSLERTGNIVGKIYAFSTLGSILGTFATGFFLISWMGTRTILLTQGILLIICAPIFGGFFFKKKMLILFFSVLALTTALAMLSLYAYAMIKSEEISSPTSPLDSLKSLCRVAFRFPVDENTTYFKESNYYTIKAMKDTGRRDNPLVTLVLDHLIHSYSDLKDPFYLEYEYIRAYEEIVRWRVRDNDSFRALFIGGGGYTFPRFLDAKYPKATMDVVEIDPEVTRVSQEYLGLSETKKVRSFNQDARWFVMNCRDKASYDFIFGDAFNDLSVPYHLTTKEFAFLLKGLLKPHGLLFTNLIDNFEKGAFMPSYVRTLEEVFGRGNVHLIMLSSDVDDVGISTMVVVASPQKLDFDDFTQTIQLEADEQRVSYVMPQEQLQQVLAERHSVVLTDDYVPVDNLLAPIFEERFGYQR